MVILQKENSDEGVFYLEQNGEVLAEMEYKKQPGKLVIQHTEVEESLRGKNIGFELVEQGVKYARESGLKIIPLCHFAKEVIERHQEFHDVL